MLTLDTVNAMAPRLKDLYDFPGSDAKLTAVASSFVKLAEHHPKNSRVVGSLLSTIAIAGNIP